MCLYDIVLVERFVLALLKWILLFSPLGKVAGRAIYFLLLFQVMNEAGLTVGQVIGRWVSRGFSSSWRLVLIVTLRRRRVCRRIIHARLHTAAFSAVALFVSFRRFANSIAAKNTSAKPYRYATLAENIGFMTSHMLHKFLFNKAEVVKLVNILCYKNKCTSWSFCTQY